MRWLVLIASLLSTMGIGTPAAAHPLAPAGLDVVQDASGAVIARFKQAAVQPRGLRLTPSFPTRCRVAASRVEVDEDSVTQVFELGCDGALEGARFGVEGLEASTIGAVAHVRLASGVVHRGLLDAARPALVVPDRADGAEVAAAYLRMGAEHMLSGLDHLLFVLGMLLLIADRKKLLVALTAFTVGHSITLCAAALGWLSVPQPPVEIAIALSLMLMAARLLRADASRPQRFVWPLAASFGLLHGLGFAGALADAGLPHGEVPLALACFNVGVELAQLAVVVVALACAPVLARAWPTSSAWRRALPAYALGSVAAMWCLERSLAALV
jgi:hydrogenase/urease accessory protein HupE